MLTLKQINGKITKIRNAEKVTKAVLGELSRELLEYVKETGDVQPVNKLISVLTPMNKRTAMLFFSHFLPFNQEDGTFTKKKRNGTFALTDEFLATDDTIWDWAADNIKVEKKEIDWTQRLTNDMTKAIEAGLTAQDIINILGQVLPEENQEVQEAA